MFIRNVFLSYKYLATGAQTQMWLLEKSSLYMLWKQTGVEVRLRPF
jgi:hypothetical protein